MGRLDRHAEAYELHQKRCRPLWQGWSIHPLLLLDDSTHSPPDKHLISPDLLTPPLLYTTTTPNNHNNTKASRWPVFLLHEVNLSIHPTHFEPPSDSQPSNHAGMPLERLPV